ncbi:MAG TPA: SLATT domain-containing protein [Actinomycetota bacterium]|nr:SLATT domain-containing protein [Actinomycetota bacterium]
MDRREADQATSEDQAAVTWTPRLDAVLEEWRRRAWAAQTAHYERATRLRRRHVWLGVPVVILSTVVGTSLFATLSEERLGLTLRIVVGSVSVGAAVLSAIQTFFAFGQRADRHVLAADWYAAIRRRMEQVQALPRDARGDARTTMDSFRKEMNTVGSQFPQIGQRDWARIAAAFAIDEPPPPTGGV